MGLGAAGGDFSHKTHAPLQLNCSRCHEGVGKNERAGFPKAETQCRVCHAGPDWKAPAIPSRRVWEQPDYVVFSHARHVREAALDCAVCHGAVAAKDVLAVEFRHSMKWCMACHKQRQATLACNACHELGQ
jgi:Zn finger protein HypA/HybF involved in hydrogenase expression